MKRIIKELSACCLLMPICLSCNMREALNRHRETTPAPVCVNVLEVAYTDNVTHRSYVGRVEPSQNVVLTTSFPAQVQTVYIKKGHLANAGEVIVELRSESVEAAYKTALAMLEQAQDGYDRMMQLYSEGGVTEVQKMDVTTQLRKAEASFATAKDALEKCNVRAPYTGIVDEVFVEEGVDLGLSAPIARILNVSAVEIHFPVPENEIRSIVLGDKAEVSVPAADDTIDARVAIKGVDASPLSHSYDCILVPVTGNPDILPGMVCKVRLSSDKVKSLIIPTRSVMTDDKGRFVWCVDDKGLVQKKYVLTGLFADGGVIISEGLKEGDRVVIDGHRKISTGMKVNVKQVQL
ncbi:MAG: efflux RND transporter periplasmic adaptor subunit [Candidatus Cryptobacteroides sp.]